MLSKLFLSEIHSNHPLGVLIKNSVLAGARRVHPLGVVPKAKVDCWQSVLGFISKGFSSFDWIEWISETGGGTLSAPTGCSPRDCGRMLAFDCSLRNV